MKITEIKELYDLGFSILYLHPKTKRPFENDWTKSPNKSWGEMKESFNSKNNIGVRLGKHSKIGDKYLACIDVDIKDPKYRKVALAKLKELTKGKVFPEVRSGSGNGSRHLYCVTKTPFKMITIAKVPDKWEICIYSTGRQMVLPPSVHPIGPLYKWQVPYQETGFPLLKHERMVSDTGGKKKLKVIENFKAVDVDLFGSTLKSSVVDMIMSCDGVTDRSPAVLSACMSMCRAGFTDNEMMSVMTDSRYELAKAALERRGGNRKSAAAWVYEHNIVKAREETSISKAFDDAIDIEEIYLDEEEEKEQTEETLQDDRRMPDIIESSGKPKPTMKNVKFVIEKHIGKVLQYDAFANRVTFLTNTVYGGKAGREVTDADDLMLKDYITTHFNFEPTLATCWEAQNAVARNNWIHPLQDWLKALEWDGVSRLDSWLKIGMGATGIDEYNAVVGRKTLVAACKRAFEPGCKFDYVLVLEGNQGKGKSTALSMLASKKWFTDNLGNIQDKDVVDQMIGKWIVELGELAAVKKIDADPLKAFLSRETDRVRMPYGRRSQDFPRSSIFIGSTNLSEYLHDETGNRRFWPVSITQANFKWIKKNREQLFAEAMFLYELGETLYLEPEIEALATKVQNKRFTTDELEAPIKQAIKNFESDRFTTTDIWRIIEESEQYPSVAECYRYSKILRKIGMVRKVYRENGKILKGWAKP